MIAVFDTNIVIDALNGIAAADTEYARYERVLISPITWIETMVGAQDDEQRVRDFLSRFFVTAPLDDATSELAVQFRRQYHMRLPDAIILATAGVQGAELVTRNTKDFDASWSGIRVPYSL